MSPPATVRFPPLADGYVIRLRSPADDVALVGIESRASELFRAHGFGAVADAPIGNVETLRAMMAGRDVRVAVDRQGAPVGFAVAGAIGRFLHLKALSVRPVPRTARRRRRAGYGRPRRGAAG